MSRAALDAPPAMTALASAILEQAPRVLSLMDREPLSPTTGCMDRTYWAWKFTDFPGARFQEGLCVLAFLYEEPLAGSACHDNPALLRWIDDGLRYWTTLQHADGSFDEAYPYERSLAATAFTGFYVAEALEFVGDALPRETVAVVRETLARGAHWLCRNDETHGFLSNHLAAAAAALWHAYRLTGDPAFERRARTFLGRILSHQSEEGWYDEYGGADPGYQTHGSFYLARLWQLTDDEELAMSLARSTRFLAHFVHPDGSLGGEYASRNTQTYYPAAFEMLSARDPAASWIAESMRPSVLSAGAAGLRAIDAYNYFPVLNNLVFAHRALATGNGVEEPRDPSPAAGLSWFPRAGIARVRTERYDAYVGTRKGGVLKVFDRNARRLVGNDCGYLGRTGSGRLATTQYDDADRAVRMGTDRIEVEGALAEISKPVMRPWRFLGFRAFSLTVGRLAGAGRWLKSQLVRVLILRRRRLDVTFTRAIHFTADSVIVEDELRGRDGQRLTDLRWVERFTTIHMGSSRYFIGNELESTGMTGATTAIDVARLSAGVRLRRTVLLD